MITPDLTTQPLTGHVSRFFDTLYERQSTLSDDRHIPLSVLRLAKKHGAPGFNKNKSQVNWTKLQSWLVPQYDTLLAESVELEKRKTTPQELTRDKLELQKLKEEVTKLKNYNRTQDKNFISRTLVNATLEKVIKEFSTIATRIWENEQPVKCAGMSTDEMMTYNRTYNDAMLNSIVTVLRDWQSAKDLEGNKDDTGTRITPND